MDLEEIYLLMNQIHFDSLNKIRHVPDKILDMFPRRKRKIKTHHNYLNLDQFIDYIYDYFFSRSQLGPVSTMPSNLRKYGDFLLKLEENIEINFSFKPKNRFPSYAIEMEVDNKKNPDIKCIRIVWCPFAKLMEIDSLFYNQRKDKIEPNIDCGMKNIPKKAGDFFLKLIEDVSKSLGVKTMTLEDASLLYLENNYKIYLGMYYLQEKGTTYYGKYGFKPYKHNGIDYVNIYYGIPFISNQSSLNYVKKELKKLKKLKESNKEDWLTQIYESGLLRIFPIFYYKKI